MRKSKDVKERKQKRERNKGMVGGSISPNICLSGLAFNNKSYEQKPVIIITESLLVLHYLSLWSFLVVVTFCNILHILKLRNELR